MRFSSLLLLLASGCLFAPYTGSEDDSASDEVVSDSGDSAEFMDTADTGEVDTDTGEVADTGSQDSGSDTSDTGSVETGDSDNGLDPYDNDGDGFSEATGDCNDDYSTVNPAALESCDERDNDCDGYIDEGLVCDTGAADTATDTGSEDSGSTDSGDSGDTDTATDTAACVDDDCDGDGWDIVEDCNDADETINPGAVEVCDVLDNDCDGNINEGDACTTDYDEADPVETDTDAGEEVEEDGGDSDSEATDTDSVDTTDTDVGSEESDTDAAADTEDTDVGSDETDTEVPEDSVDTTDSDDTVAEEEDTEVVEEEEASVATFDPDADGDTNLCWELLDGFEGGELWVWDSSAVRDPWVTVASAPYGTIATEMCGDTALIASGDISWIQGYYWTSPSTYEYIAANVGDSDGDGVYEFTVVGDLTFDDIDPVFVAAISWDGDADGITTGEHDGAYAMTMAP